MTTLWGKVKAWLMPKKAEPSQDYLRAQAEFIRSISDSVFVEDGPKKRGPGRPKGSLNKRPNIVELEKQLGRVKTKLALLNAEQSSRAPIWPREVMARKDAMKLVVFLSEAGIRVSRSDVVRKAFAGKRHAAQIDAAIGQLLAATPPKIVIETQLMPGAATPTTFYRLNESESTWVI